MTVYESSRPQDKVIILRRVPFFAACTEAQLHFIADRTRLVECKKGEFIYRAGAPADAFYIVSSGRLRVFSGVEGEEKTFTVLHNGDSFGEISLLIGETHSANVQALNDALVLKLEKRHFDDVINRIPSLVLYLSRTLSKRLRMRERGGEFAESTIAAIYSAAKGVGRTSFAVSLAATLQRETGEGVVLVDFSGGDSDARLLYGAAAPRPTTRVPVRTSSFESLFKAAVTTHPMGFQVLAVSHFLTDDVGEQAIAPLLNYLTNRFQYVLIDLPVRMDARVQKALTQSDRIYLVTDPQRDHIIRTNALIYQLQSPVSPIDQRVKVVINRLAGPGEWQMSLSDVVEQMDLPVAFSLPHLSAARGRRLTADELASLLEDRGLAYSLTVRRIARELGGMLVGLALGSGAALGLAHIGILRVLEREQVPIDMVAGSSIGALVGGLWASGSSADDLERLALQFKNPWDIRQLFMLDFGIPMLSVCIGIVAGMIVGWLGGFWTGLLFGFMVCIALGLILGPLSGGPIQGARLAEKLDRDFQGKTFEDTWLPLKVVAANPMSREEVVFESGELAKAVRASVSIPGIFKPVTVKGRICLDGGVMNPIPVSVLKNAGCNHVIAVNVFPTTPELVASREAAKRRRLEREAQVASKPFMIRVVLRIQQELFRSVSPLIFDVIMRSMQAMEYQMAEVACREADLTLRPTVPGSHWLEFFHPEPFIRRGEEVALQHLPELKRITRARDVDNL